MSGDYRTCSNCGRGFRTSGGPGRPATRCDVCRGVLRSDDTAWRTIKVQVLREEPVCAVRGCSRPSTTVDHKIPLAKGGSRLDRANLQGMCGPHNFSKGDRLPPVGPVCACADELHGSLGCRVEVAPGRRICTRCDFFSCADRPQKPRWVL